MVRVEKTSKDERSELFAKKEVGEFGIVRDSAPRSSDGMTPPFDASPSQAAS